MPLACAHSADKTRTIAAGVLLGVNPHFDPRLEWVLWDLQRFEADILDYPCESQDDARERRKR